MVELEESDTEQYYCEACDEDFDFNDEFNQHMQTFHQNVSCDSSTKLKCPLCPEDQQPSTYLGDAHQLSKHFVASHPVSKGCEETSSTTQSCDDVSVGVVCSSSNDSVNNPSLSCHLCSSQSFESPMLLLTHLRSVHTTKPRRLTSPTFVCPECEEMFESTEEVEDHIASSHPRGLSSTFSREGEELDEVKKEVFTHDDDNFDSDEFGYFDDDFEKVIPSTISRRRNGDLPVKKRKKCKREKSILNNSSAFDDGDALFSCPFCNSIYISSEDVQSHIILDHHHKRSPSEDEQHDVDDENDTTDSVETSKRVKSSKTKRAAPTSAKFYQNGGGENGGSNPISFFCSVCEAEFPSSLDVRNHCRDVHSATEDNKDGLRGLVGGSLTCPLCPADQNEITFDTEFDLKKHMMLFDHPSPSTLAKKIKKESGKTERKKASTEPCCECEMDIPKKLMKRHLKEVHNITRKKCSSSSSPTSYGVEGQTCPFCEEKYTNGADMRSHITFMHEIGDQYACPQCDKLFSMRNNLRRHIIHVHTRNKRYPCDLCDGSFTRASDMRRHIMSVHDKIKNFVCHQCGKCFAKSGHVERHIMSVHDKIKNYVCPLCSKAFSQKGDLKGHILSVHEKIKKRSGPLSICNIDDM